MKTLFRAMVLLALSVWIGGLIFFPFLAQSAFGFEANRQTAGLIVGASLKDLHWLGLSSGVLLLVLLALGQVRRSFDRTAIPAITLLLVMLAITAASQFAVIPRMDADRTAAGGSISLAPLTDPNRIAFERLHQASVTMEALVLATGLLLVIAVAWMDSSVRRRPS